MPIENIESIATSVGLGGIMGFLLGYFIRKIIKIILFAVVGFCQLLIKKYTRDIQTLLTKSRVGRL